MVFIDLETYSELDVTRVGSYAYANHPSTEILLLCYAVDDGPVICYEKGTLEAFPNLLYGLGDYLVAHNCGFERAVLNAVKKRRTQASDWHDTAVLARTCGLPGKLETLCKVLDVEAGKRKLKGNRLIQMFCKPTPRNHNLRRYTKAERPDEWAEFIEYCKADVEACRHVWQTLPKNVYNRERENWLIDQDINDRGLPVDLPMIDAALELVDEQLRLADERIHEITGGAVPTVASVAALAAFCGLTSVDKDGVAQALVSARLSAAQREALLLRQEAGKSSTAKYLRAKESAVGGRVRDALMFYGAQRTGRESGQLIQPQNMARPGMEEDALATARRCLLRGTVDVLYDSPIGVASSLVRTLIAAKPGHKLVIADLANIEGRKLAWLVGEKWKLDAFRAYDAGTGDDIYKLTYARTFGVDVSDVTKAQRQVGKVEELAFGFGGAVGAFESMSAAYGVTLPTAEILTVVQGWRRAHPETKQAWYDYEKAAKAAVENPGATFTTRRVKFGTYRAGKYLWLVAVLPSGRALFYFEPRIYVDGSRSGALAYTGQVVGSTWGRVDTWGGKLAENITQASARDILFAGIATATEDGFDVVLHSHDEIVAECPDSEDWTVERLSACLTKPLHWCADLPLAAAGYEDYFYRKD